MGINTCFETAGKSGNDLSAGKSGNDLSSCDNVLLSKHNDRRTIFVSMHTGVAYRLLKGNRKERRVDESTTKRSLQNHKK